MKNKQFVLFLGLFTILGIGFSSCAQEPGPLLAPFVRGFLVFEEIGVINAKVTLVKGDEQTVVYSDDGGGFQFEGIDEGTYTIIPEKHGWIFEPPSEELVIGEKIPDQVVFSGKAAEGYDIDAWGYVWESVLRNGTWQEAVDYCESVGGRLPTPTEIYRSNHSLDSLRRVGILDTETYLWTIIQNDPLTHVTLNLIDGTASYQTTTLTMNYRCIWPDKERDTFSGTFIYTDTGDKGFPININGKRFYTDKYSRPQLSYNAAMRESAFYHGFIPTLSLYSVAIKDGLPNGVGITDNDWHWTNDMTGYNNNQYCVEVVRWDDDFDSYNATYSKYITHYHKKYSGTVYTNYFRITGVSEYPGKIYPDLSTEIWFDPASRMKITSHDLPVANFMTVLALAFETGGHVPYLQEYGQLIQEGLPGGTNLWLWTAEFGSSYNDGNVAIVTRWNGDAAGGTKTDFTGYSETYDEVSYAGINATTKYSYRTIYYPIDPYYSGPPESVNREQLFYYEKERPDGEVLKIWVDKYNRPAKTYIDALMECHELEGHLTSARDLMELIRVGLPNDDTLDWLWTSTVNYYDSQEVLAWKGIVPVAEGNWNTNLTHSAAYQTANHKFRGIWTNELRLP